MGYVIDFESRSFFPLKTGGLHKYARHFSTEILSLAFKKDDERTHVWLYTDPVGFPLALFLDDIRRGAPVEAHNAEFELQIWNNVGCRLHGWPELKPEQMRCSLARASMAGLPKGLGALAAALGTSVQKDDEGYRLMLAMCKPDTFSGKFVETKEMLRRLGEYCKTDVETEYACGKLLPHLPAKEQALWALTVKMNDRGLGLDLPLCSAAVEMLEENDRRLHGDIRDLTGGKCRTGRQVAKMIEELADEGVEMGSMDKASVAKALQGEYLTPRAHALLTARAEIAKASVRKYRTMLNMVADDGKIRGTLRYHAAGTGRWAGAGIQPQNFYRPTVKNTAPILEALQAVRDATLDFERFQAQVGSVGEALANTLRNMLVPSAGKTFYDGDYSAIEARVLAWLAGDEETLALYRQEFDTYKRMACLIYDCQLPDVTPERRQLGKKVELGCGYGLGKDRFYDSCREEGLGITPALADMAVKTYRAAHKPIVGFWYGLEAAAIQAVSQKGAVVECGKIKLLSTGKYLLVRLPSGRKLYYYNPIVRIQETKVGEKPVLSYLGEFHGKAASESTYGGKLVENVTQATARDILAGAMLDIEDTGMQNVLTVHDEILAEVDPAVHSLAHFTEVMQRVPEWATGLPLKVGAWQGSRYRK